MTILKRKRKSWKKELVNVVCLKSSESVSNRVVQVEEVQLQVFHRFQAVEGILMIVIFKALVIIVMIIMFKALDIIVMIIIIFFF